MKSWAGDQVRNPRLTSDQLAGGMVLVAIAVLACLAPAQGDTWWLLRAGRDLFSTGQIPMVESYSHTAAGRHWANHEWLTEAVFYALYRLGGMPLLAGACAAAATAAWALSYSLTRGAFEVRFIALLGAVIPAAMSFALRPQMLSMFCFAATSALLVRNRLRWIPAIVIVWANLHGAVALGLVSVGGAWAAAAIVGRRLPAALTWTLLATAVATLVTPLGLELWTFWVDSALHSELHALVEWRPPDFRPELWPFWAVAATFIVATLRNWKKLDAPTWTAVGIALAVLPLALQATRNVPFFLLAALPALTRVMATQAPAVRPRREVPRAANTWVLGTTVVGAALLVAALWAQPAALLGWRPFSDDVIAAISRCRGPLFNTYGDGGALMWFVPSAPVFIDSRQVLEPYPMDLVTASRQAESDGQFEPLFEKYGIRCACLPAESPIADGLRRDADWTVRHADSRWAVFEKTRAEVLTPRAAVEEARGR